MNALTEDTLDANTRLATPHGPMNLRARVRGRRWAVSLACGGRSAVGIGPDLAGALHGAFALYEAARDPGSSRLGPVEGQCDDE